MNVSPLDMKDQIEQFGLTNNKTQTENQLFLANLMLEDIAKNSLWSDEFFQGKNIEEIENKLSPYILAHHGNVRIHGFSYGPNIEKLLRFFPMGLARSIDLLELRKANVFLFERHRLLRLSSVLSSYRLPQVENGVCVLSTKKILGAELGINQHDGTDLLRQISSLKSEISNQNSKIVELESQISVSKAKIRDNEEILAGRANLTWS